MANTCPSGDIHHQLEGMFKKIRPVLSLYDSSKGCDSSNMSSLFTEERVANEGKKIVR
jgi:hypothetical protein